MNHKGPYRKSREGGVRERGTAQICRANCAPNLRKKLPVFRFVHQLKEGCAKLSQICREFESQFRTILCKYPFSNAPLLKFLKGTPETGGLANGYFVNRYFEFQFAREKQIFHRIGRSHVFARGVLPFSSLSLHYRGPSRDFPRILKVPVCKVPVCELLRKLEVCAEKETGGILLRECCFGSENSLSSSANSVSSAKNSLSSLWQTRPEGPGIEKNRSRPLGLNISSDRSWIEIFDPALFCNTRRAPWIETPRDWNFRSRLKFSIEIAQISSQDWNVSIARPSGHMILGCRKYRGNKWGLKGCLAALPGNRPKSALFTLFLPFSPFSGGCEEHLENPENGGKRPFSSDILRFA